MNARVDICLQALEHNLSIVKKHAKNAPIMAVIKANAYGHGMAQVADALKQADGYAVACLQEALELRKNGITQKILVLQGFTSQEELLTMVSHQLTPVIHSPIQLDIVHESTLDRPLLSWIKVDSGMGRLGFSEEALRLHWSKIFNHKRIAVECLMTHLACADEKDSPQTVQQLHVFTRILKDTTLEERSFYSSIANSAAIFDHPETCRDNVWVRPGLMLYGASPFIDRTAQQLDLQPVMTLTAPLIALRQHRQGDLIGYGGTWTCPESMRVGIAAIGYGDGYPRHIKTGTVALLNGKRTPIIGRVSMDMLCLDLRGHASIRVGERITCWGKGLPIEEIAHQADTLPYELLCQLTPRAQRVYL